ncbi:MAG: DUF485 domain-containing protein [Deltaproteobacteria bacterium]|nr:DUF485 domain-containing protein [Deltaproteobacteria bacterium]
MGGLDFKPGAPQEEEDEAIVRYNTRLGVYLFIAYVAFYGGFMAMSAFWPEVIGSPWLGGVNMSVLYGFALIVVAIMLALLYQKLSRKPGDGGAK